METYPRRLPEFLLGCKRLRGTNNMQNTKKLIVMGLMLAGAAPGAGLTVVRNSSVQSSAAGRQERVNRLDGVRCKHAERITAISGRRKETGFAPTTAVDES